VRLQKILTAEGAEKLEEEIIDRISTFPLRSLRLAVVNWFYRKGAKSAKELQRGWSRMNRRT